MAELQENGGWAPTPTEDHHERGRQLVAEGWYQTSRAHRSIARGRFEGLPEEHLELTIDEFAAYRKAGGATYEAMKYAREIANPVYRYVVTGVRLTGRSTYRSGSSRATKEEAELLLLEVKAELEGIGHAARAETLDVRLVPCHPTTHASLQFDFKDAP